jgi:hypothetical protein
VKKKKRKRKEQYFCGSLIYSQLTSHRICINFTGIFQEEIQVSIKKCLFHHTGFSYDYFILELVLTQLRKINLIAINKTIITFLIYCIPTMFSILFYSWLYGAELVLWEKYVFKNSY